jgi:fumarate reductase flavoprotein subunit
MSWRNIFLFSILLFFTLVLAVGCHKDLKVSEANEPSAQEKLIGGCISCHDTLKAVLPEVHLPVKNDDLRSCLTCHRPFDAVIHFAHYSTEGLVENCWSCHRTDDNAVFGLIGLDNKEGTKVEKELVEKMAPYFLSWGSSDYLDHKHANNGTDCRSCHEADFPDTRASMDQCLNCHSSYEQLAELTSGLEPNPHSSHYEDLRCTVCHKAHQASELYCNKCHEFEMTVP